MFTFLFQTHHSKSEVFVKGWRALSESSYTTTGFSSPSGCGFWQTAAATYPGYYFSFASHSNADCDLTTGQTHPLRLSTGSEGSNCSPKVLKYTAFYCIFVLQPGTSLSTLLCGANVCNLFHTCLSVYLFFKTWSCRVIKDGTHNPLASLTRAGFTSIHPHQAHVSWLYTSVSA